MTQEEEKRFAECLIRFLESDVQHCVECPLTAGDDCCDCRGFMGLASTAWSRCPCAVYGAKEAIKQAWIRLEERGHLE